MSDNSSFRLRSRERVRLIALDAQRMVREAASPIPPGVSIKGQLRLACRALGYPDGDWRVRAAWYAEAGSWSAAAFEDLKDRFQELERRQQQAARAEALRAAVLFERIVDDDASLQELDGKTATRLRLLARRMRGEPDET